MVSIMESFIHHTDVCAYFRYKTVMLSIHLCFIVALEGLEPSRDQFSADFLTTLCYHSHLNNVVVWTMSLPYQINTKN